MFAGQGVLQLRLTWHKRIPKPLLEPLCHSKKCTKMEEPKVFEPDDPDYSYKATGDEVDYRNEFAELDDLIRFAMTGF